MLAAPISGGLCPAQMLGATYPMRLNRPPATLSPRRGVALLRPATMLG
jgi:hypothetical protein